MSKISVVPTRPIQVEDPADRRSSDEHRTELVPVQLDELPQGVLDLMALLIRPGPAEPRGAMAWHTTVAARRSVEIEFDGTAPIVQATMDIEPDAVQPNLRAAMLFSEKPLLSATPVQQALPQRPDPAASVVDRVMPAALAVLPEPMNRPLASDTPTAPIGAEQIPQLPSNLQAPRQASSVVSVQRPLPPMPSSTSDALVEALPSADRGLLQIPFNKGAASGQVVISRGPEEPTRNLTLSPSNALVFEQLKEPFELAREPAWRLAERGGEQQRQGAQSSPDEDQDESAEHSA